MSLKDWTPKIAAFGVVGSAITVLFIMGITAISQQKYRPATWFVVSGVGLTLIFFRRRKIAFAIVVLSFLFVNAGMTALFLPTAAGLAVTFGSGFGMYLLVVWSTKKYPHLAQKDWKTIFDGDPEK
jgi:hypothetical protein